MLSILDLEYKYDLDSDSSDNGVVGGSNIGADYSTLTVADTSVGYDTVNAGSRISGIIDTSGATTGSIELLWWRPIRRIT